MACAPYVDQFTQAETHLMQVLRLVIKLYEGVPEPDWVNICQCLMFLDDAQEVAKIVNNLLKGSEVCGRRTSENGHVLQQPYTSCIVLSIGCRRDAVVLLLCSCCS